MNQHIKKKIMQVFFFLSRVSAEGQNMIAAKFSYWLRLASNPLPPIPIFNKIVKITPTLSELSPTSKYTPWRTKTIKNSANETAYDILVKNQASI